jgi:hypothetical protein
VKCYVSHSEPFACHSEQSEESSFFAQDKLREESLIINELENGDSSADASE